MWKVEPMNRGAGVPAPEPVGIRDFFAMFRGKAFKPTMILLYAALALSIWRYIPPAPHLVDPRATAAFVAANGLAAPSADVSESTDSGWIPFFRGETRIFAAFVVMGLIPALIVRFVFREKLSDYGVRFGNRFTVRSLLIFTPVMILLGYLASFNGDFATIYPYNPHAADSRLRFILHAALFFGLYYTAWEFMFRGFMLRGLSDSCGMFNAVLIAALASAMLHYGHPLTEVLGAVGGGVFWGLLAFRTRSILSGAIQHAVLGISLDFFLVSTFLR